MSNEQWTRDDAALVDLFDIAGDRVLTLGVVGQWTDEQCQQAEEWAWALHFAASDNPEVVVPPIPPHVESLQRFDSCKADADAQMNPATAGDRGSALTEGLGVVTRELAAEAECDAEEGPLLVAVRKMLAASIPQPGCYDGYIVPAEQWLAVQSEAMHQLRELARRSLGSPAPSAVRGALASRDGCDYATAPGAVCKKCWKVHDA